MCIWQPNALCSPSPIWRTTVSADDAPALRATALCGALGLWVSGACRAHWTYSARRAPPPSSRGSAPQCRNTFAAASCLPGFSANGSGGSNGSRGPPCWQFGVRGRAAVATLLQRFYPTFVLVIRSRTPPPLLIPPAVGSAHLPLLSAAESAPEESFYAQF